MWQGTTQLQTGSMPITLAITEIQRPPLPSVLSVQDRQVYVDNIEVPPPGYVLARRWVRNEPEVDVEQLAGSHNHLVLPQPLPAGPGSSDESPVFPDDSEDYDPEEAVRALKQHWVNVRKYDTQQRMQRLARYTERLKAITTPTMHPVNVAVTQALLAQAQAQQQQHQQQQHQQQQQQQGQSLAVLLGGSSQPGVLPAAAPTPLAAAAAVPASTVGQAATTSMPSPLMASQPAMAGQLLLQQQQQQQSTAALLAQQQLQAAVPADEAATTAEPHTQQD